MNTKTRTTGQCARALVASGVVALCSAAGTAAAATVQSVTGFGSNPTGIGMYLYTPTNVVAHPPILVGVHACHGKGMDVCAQGTPFAAQADKYGFLLVCPSAISSDGCWDVHSNAVLTHNGGGDAAGIISMVNYLVANKNGDAGRVYVAGHSSGGMMTNVLAGAYPDVFKAGAAFAGVAFGCFAGNVDSLGWNATCADGNVSKTGAQWGDLVRAAYPGYTGARPRMQLWHGTVDATVNFKNFAEEIKTWTNVLGVSETPASTENNAVQSTWIRTRYLDSAGVVQVEAVAETGQPHNLVLVLAEAVRFFGLDGSNPVPDGGVDATVGSGGSGGNAGAGGGRGGNAGGGGASGSGGRGGMNGSGGGSATGGSNGSGGGSATGGSNGSGGGSATGGSNGSGGATASGGAGPSTGSGGAPMNGNGTGGSASSAAQGGGSAAGCSFNPGHPRGGAAFAWLILAVGACFAIRRRR